MQSGSKTSFDAQLLPKGFRRARNFGFLHPNRKRTVALLQLILIKFDPKRLLPHLKTRPAMLCQCCGAPMQIVQTMIGVPVWNGANHGEGLVRFADAVK